jgi:hypothetical protein
MDASPVLSRAEVAIVRSAHDPYGAWDEWRLVEFAHNLPEYTPTPHTSIPIPLTEVLSGLGLNESAIAGRLAADRQHDAMDRLLASA